MKKLFWAKNFDKHNSFKEFVDLGKYIQRSEYHGFGSVLVEVNAPCRYRCPCFRNRA